MVEKVASAENKIKSPAVESEEYKRGYKEGYAQGYNEGHKDAYRQQSGKYEREK